MNFRPLSAVIVALAAAVSLPFIRAQDSQLSVTDIISLAREQAALEPVAEKIVPVLSLEPSMSGTFWSLQQDTAPLPFLPFPQLETVEISPGVFLFDDRAVDYSAVRKYRRLALSLQTLEGEYGMEATSMTASSVPSFPGEGEEWETNDIPVVEFVSPVYGTNELYLTISGITNGWTLLDLMNTRSGNIYELLSSDVVSTPRSIWFSEGYVEGFDGVTPTMVSAHSTSNLFFSARNISLDSSGQGIPDYWLLTYFGTTETDVWADPDGDGWSNFQEFLNNTSPVAANLPPAPCSLSATVDGTGTNVTISWKSGGGSVQSFQIFEDGVLRDWAGATDSQMTFQSRFNYVSYSSGSDEPQLIVRALFNGGSYRDSDPVTVSRTMLNQDIRLARGALGSMYLTIPNSPTAFDSVSLRWTSGADVNLAIVDIPAARFTGGVALLQDGEWRPYVTNATAIVAQLYATNRGSGINHTWFTSPDERDFDELQLQNVDMATVQKQIRQNLRFVLRAAGVTRPFGFATGDGIVGSSAGFGTDPFRFLGRTNGITDYAYYGFRNFSPDWECSIIQGFRPILENYLWRRFEYSPADFGPYLVPTNGPGYDFDLNMRTMLGSEAIAVRQSSAAFASAGTVFSNAVGTGIYFSPSDQLEFEGEMPEVGLLQDLNTLNLSLGSNVRNLFGLRIESVQFRSDEGEFLNLPRGTTIPDVVPMDLFVNVENPILVIDGYHFAAQDPRSEWSYYSGIASAPLPGQAEFFPNSDMVTLTASPGEPVSVSAWARHGILNNLPSSKYAFEEQFFENSYLIDTDGEVTTNRTGLLSPFGEFFPTESGPVALVTVPDIQTGERGTGIVHVISMDVDANRDGIMDSSFGGPDHRSWTNPFRFWINDDDDYGEIGGKDIPGYPEAQKKTPNGKDAVVNGVRDLIDFFPVRLNIQSLLQSYPSNTLACWLKQSDEALRIVDPEAPECQNLVPTNCLAFLTDTNLAIGLGGPFEPPNGIQHPGRSTIQIGSGPGYYLGNAFVNRIRNEGKGMILLEASKPTTNPLTLEVWNGTNLIARTHLYLNISSVEKMFRHKNLIRETFGGSAGFDDRLNDSDVPNEPETNEKNFVFLHGYNVNPNQSRGTFAETFKRMFWSGSRARFWGVSWRGYESQVGPLTPNYHINVKNAFLTAPHLSAFLSSSNIQGEVTVTAHSLGNMVTLVSINDWSAPIDRYYMLDAAVPIEAVDGAAIPNQHMTFSEWVSPENYANRLYASYWANLFPANDSRSTLTWSNRLANFRNTEVFNFYSSGEEVLRAYENDPPFSAFGSASLLLHFYEDNPPAAAYAWVFQEKSKGCSINDTVLGSTHGGWKLNTAYKVNGNWLPASQANALSVSQLRTNSFFSFDDGSQAHPDLALLHSGGSSYAFYNQHRILADSIPAMTWPIGANSVPRLAPDGEPNRNFNMQALFKNGWPARRSGAEAVNWWHSDFRDVAYLYVHRVFGEFVEKGGLK